MGGAGRDGLPAGFGCGIRQPVCVGHLGESSCAFRRGEPSIRRTAAAAVNMGAKLTVSE